MTAREAVHARLLFETGFDSFELFKRGLDVDFLHVSKHGMSWVHDRLPIRYRAAAYREATKQIRNGRPTPFAIPVTFKAPEFITTTCCR